MHVFGLLGKLLTGPRMSLFYTADNRVDFVDGIAKLKSVLDKLQDLKDNPMDALLAESDLFGSALSESDSTLQQLRKAPQDENIFL